MDIGLVTPKSILRNESVLEEASTSARKRLSWAAKLITRTVYPPEEEMEVVEKKANAPKKKRQEKKKKKKKAAKKPKEAQPSKDDSIDEDVTKHLVMKDDDSDEDTKLLVEFTKAKETMKKKFDKLISEANSAKMKKKVAEDEAHEYEEWTAAMLNPPSSDDSDVEFIDTMVTDDGEKAQLLITTDELKEEEGDDEMKRNEIDDMPHLNSLFRAYNEDIQARVEADGEEKKETGRKSAERRRTGKPKKNRKMKELKRKKKEELEKEPKEEKMDLVDRKPRSRAEAARRTKALLGIGTMKDHLVTEEETEDDGEEPKMKRRKYTRRETTPFVRRAKENDEEGCGKYIHNPCDISVEQIQTDHALDGSEEEDGDEEHHDVLSLPFPWTSEEERKKRKEGKFGSLNADSEDPIKRQLIDVQEFSDGISTEYRSMVKRLDGMRLNLFAETTLRRTDHRTIHNINPLSTWSIWPSDLLPGPDVTVPKYQFQAWKRPLTEKLVRIRPTRATRDKLISAELDQKAGGAVVPTRKDIVKNVDDLILSKLKMKTWTPLPSARNPFDVPEISTRSFVS